MAIEGRFTKIAGVCAVIALGYTIVDHMPKTQEAADQTEASENAIDALPRWAEELNGAKQPNPQDKAPTDVAGERPLPKPETTPPSSSIKEPEKQSTISTASTEPARSLSRTNKPQGQTSLPIAPSASVSTYGGNLASPSCGAKYALLPQVRAPIGGFEAFASGAPTGCIEAEQGASIGVEIQLCPSSTPATHISVRKDGGSYRPISLTASGENADQWISISNGRHTANDGVERWNGPFPGISRIRLEVAGRRGRVNQLCAIMIN